VVKETEPEIKFHCPFVEFRQVILMMSRANPKKPNPMAYFPFPDKIREILFVLLVVLCLSTLISPPIALLLGLVFAQLVGHPFAKSNGKWTGWLLKGSVVLLGFGINITDALRVGREGFWLTLFSIALTLLAGWLLSIILKTDKKTSFLITCGTAICGGSAIAAMSPIVKAEDKKIGVALGTVFILNAIALFIFPFIGNALSICAEQFGLWAAIAIHDTSSVVGASASYSPEAVEVATTVKLMRALWIIPVSIIAMFFVKAEDQKISIPYFILLFIGAMCLTSFVSLPATLTTGLSSLAKAGLTATLFLIGAGLPLNHLKSVGVKPLALGVSLWLLVSVVSLVGILYWMC
jgi:uncharacterized integral membrane protein (TIGR00698 family)